LAESAVTPSTESASSSMALKFRKTYEVPSLAEPRERLPFQLDPVLGGRGGEVALGVSSRHSQKCGGR